MSLDDASAIPSRRWHKGLRGWWKRLAWRRASRKMTESDIEELRKRLIIVGRQLEELPDTSRVFKRRMELLRDRERCETIIAIWEAERQA